MPRAPSKKTRRKREPAPPDFSSIPPRSLRKDLLVGALVGVSLLVITGLYAFTLRFQDAFQRPVATGPRWTLLKGDLVDRTEPIKAQLGELAKTFGQMSSAGKTQKEAALVLKKKLESRSATSTPETPAP